MSIFRLCVVLLTVTPFTLAADPAVKPPREALQPFNLLVGSWKGTGYPEGTSKDDRAKGFWQETIAWTWQFKGADAWLTVQFEKGRHYANGELRYRPKTDDFELTLTTPQKATEVFTGTLKDKVLTLDRTDPATKEERRFVVTMLHHNRYLYRLETKPAGGFAFAKKYQVGATKEGVPFAEVGKGEVCIVSGGAPSIRVSYKGKDYFVCCSGCRAAFNDEPEKFIKEAEAAKLKETDKK